MNCPNLLQQSHPIDGITGFLDLSVGNAVDTDAR
jgi:hypothetical protein